MFEHGVSLLQKFVFFPPHSINSRQEEKYIAQILQGIEQGWDRIVTRRKREISDGSMVAFAPYLETISITKLKRGQPKVSPGLNSGDRTELGRLRQLDTVGQRVRKEEAVPKESPGICKDVPPSLGLSSDHGVRLFQSRERISSKSYLQMNSGETLQMEYRELISWVWVTRKVLKLTPELGL